MRKEVIIAIITGSVIGIFLAFFLTQRVRKSPLRETGDIASSTESTPSASPTHITNNTPATVTGELALLTPKQNSPIPSRTTLGGTNARDSAFLIIFINGDEYLVRADSANFSTPVILTPGISRAELVAVLKNNSLVSKNAVLLVTSLSSQMNSETKGAYGVITDITESALQMRIEGGNVEQVTISSDTVYKNVIKTAKDIKVGDLAIGDFIGAFGTQSNRGVLTASEILVDTPEEATPAAVISGVIKTAGTKQLVITGAQGEESSVTIGTHALRRLTADNAIVRVQSNVFKPSLPVLVTDKTIYLLP